MSCRPSACIEWAVGMLSGGNCGRRACSHVSPRSLLPHTGTTPTCFFASVLAVCRTWSFLSGPCDRALSQNADCTAGDIWLNAVMNMYCDRLACIVHAMCLGMGICYSPIRYVTRFHLSTRPVPHVVWNTCVCRTKAIAAVCRCVHLAESTTFFWAEPQPMSKGPVPLAWPSVSCAALHAAHLHCGS